MHPIRRKGTALRPMLILLQETTGLGKTPGPEEVTPPGAPPLSAVQVGVLVFLIAVVALMIFLLFRVGVGSETLTQDQRSWLDYGNFYVVALGITAVVIGFLVTLLFLDRFRDGTQALGLLTALFGVITGLVGTYFGIKASSDARSGAESLARETGGATTPTITIEPTTANQAVSTPHTVTATVTSVDGSPASETPATFAITDGPDAGTPQARSTELTDSSGKARFTFTNNGTEGKDTIEAVALGGRSTATVTFLPTPPRPTPPGPAPSGPAPSRQPPQGGGAQPR